MECKNSYGEVNMVTASINLKNMKILSTIILFILSSFALFPQSEDGFDEEECSFNGIKLHGKIQFVESFPDITIKVVESFPDLKVKIVDSFPDDCGEWQIVDSFPDIKIKIVESFPDLEIKFVESFPGIP
jgi:hypothetical protein